MPVPRVKVLVGLGFVFVLCFWAGCKARGDANSEATATPPFMSHVAQNPPSADSQAPPPGQMGGFDGSLAYQYVAKQVSFGPRPASSPALAKTRDYIISQLKSFGCTVDTDSFSADTPIGRLQMENFVVKIPGERKGIILLGTHYDTARLDNFVGADDGGSSTGLMMEMAHLLCGKRGRFAVWIAFFDGEEAQKQWSDLDSLYGSREMAARMELDGNLKDVRAMLLADIVGGKNLRILREPSSTRWLTDLIWSTADKLGYKQYFLDENGGAEDDHDSFLKRGVPAVDVINDFPHLGYWHTPQDNMDKISARSLAIVGHVFVETVKQLQEK